MVNRPAGGARSKRHKREPYDWYCDPPYCARQIMERLSFDDDLIFDPCCGKGTILDVAKARGHPTIGGDVIDRHARHKFERGNFLQRSKLPTMPGRQTSIICNPPYSYETEIAERIIRKALTFHFHRAAFILPIAFLCSVDRWTFFEREFKPSHIAYYSQRPSMPPGSTVDEYTTFTGGMADYCAIIYSSGTEHRWRTESIWLKPDSI